MKNKLDMRGYSCPVPLLRTRDALASCEDLTVLVDEPAARENIIKFAKSQNCQVNCTDGNGEWTLTIRKNPT